MVRLLRLRLHLDLFRGCVFPDRRYDEPAHGDGRHLRGGLFHAAARRLAVRVDRRHARPQEFDGDLGAHDVRRVADDRHPAHLCDHWRRGAGALAGRAPGAGPFGRWRIRDRRDLHERGRRQRASRLLFLLPVRDPHRRTASGASGAGGAANASVGGRTQGLGLAHPIRHWRIDRRRRDVSAPLAGGNRLRGGNAQQGSRVAARDC